MVNYKMDEDYKILLNSSGKSEIVRAMKSVENSDMSMVDKNYYLARGHALLGNEVRFSKYFEKIPNIDPRKPDLIALFKKSKNLDTKNLIIRASLGVGAVAAFIMLGKCSK